MPLPILSAHHASAEDLMRFFHKTELHWGRHVAEETQLDVGTALSNPELKTVWDANRMLDAALPDGVDPAHAVEEAEAHFAKVGATCWSWTLARSAPAERIGPLAEHLISRGFLEDGFDVMYLDQPRGMEEAAGLTIIPARASFKHYRMLAEEWAGQYNTPDFVEAVMMHLDDPHVDALVALKDQKPAGFVAVLSVGEIGGIQEMFVSGAFRNQGIGRTMMSRALEICARSLFRHVFVGVDPQNAAAVQLYSKAGFKRLGRYVQYRRPK